MTSIWDFSTEDELLAWAAMEWELSPQELSGYLKACMLEVQRAEQAIDQALDSKRARAGLSAAKEREERALKARSSAWMAMLRTLDASTFEALGRAAAMSAARDWESTPWFFEALFNRMGQQLSEEGHDVSRWQRIAQESLGCVKD